MPLPITGGVFNAASSCSLSDSKSPIARADDTDETDRISIGWKSCGGCFGRFAVIFKNQTTKNGSGSKVEEQSDFKVGSSQVIEQLPLMRVLNCSRSFEFENNQRFNDHIARNSLMFTPRKRTDIAGCCSK